MRANTDYRFESARRYYTARLSIDLLGDCVVDIAAGGLFNRNGKCWTVSVPSMDAGIELLDEIAHIRKLRRYRLVAVN